MPTGPFKSMQEQLAAWGFKPVDENGRTDTIPKPEESATVTVVKKQADGNKTNSTNIEGFRPPPYGV